MAAQIELFEGCAPPEPDRDTWRTPQELFEGLARRFGPFRFDAAADEKNALCERFATRETDGLLIDWAKVGPVWCNPPFSEIAPWTEKAAVESRRGAQSVLLLPGHRTEQDWWRRWVVGEAAEVLAIRKRVEYAPPPGVESSGCGFCSVAVVYSGQRRPGRTVLGVWPPKKQLRQYRGRRAKL